MHVYENMKYSIDSQIGGIMYDYKTSLINTDLILV